MNLFSLRDDRGPDAAVAFDSRGVAAVRLEHHGRTSRIAAYALVPLPEGALTPSLAASNVQDRTAVVAALQRALEEVGRPRRIGIVVADPAAKMSLLKFQHVPSKAAELDQLIRWQAGKASPFPIDQAQVSYAGMGSTPEGQEYLVTIARTDVVTEYESLCAGTGAVVGLVDVSTTSVINAVVAGDGAGGDRLLVNMAPGWTSLAVLRGDRVALLRTRTADGGEPLADLVHQTAMYYEDRLGGSAFSQVLLCGAAADGDDAPRVQADLEARLKTPVSQFDPTGVVPLADGSKATPVLADALAPALGLLVRTRKAVA